MKRIFSLGLGVFFVLVFLILAAFSSNGRIIGAGQRFIFRDHVVEDTQTRLFWARNANPAESRMSWDDANDYITNLNQQKFAGFSDWRLPDVDEMRSLSEAARRTGAGDRGADATAAAALGNMGFKNVQAADYWSSSSSLFNETEAWYFNMGSGSKAMGSKSLYRHVWPVRWRR